MNKYEYIYLLKNNLSYYEGNIDEIVQNYENIIDEMLDEGLSMEDITRRLGSPAVLAEEIVQELGLKYTQEYRNQTSVPQWTRILLIICGVVLFIPASGVILGFLGTIFGLFVAAIGAVIGGLIGSFAIWAVPGMPVLLKLLISVTALCACIAVAIIIYFIAYGLLKITFWIFQKIRELISGGRRAL